MALPTTRVETSPAARLTRLNNLVSISPPLSDSYDSGSPSLIIIFGWFRAKLDHILKYAEKFHYFYPTSTIIIVEAQFSWLYHTQSKRESFLQGVADVLADLQSKEGAGFRGVLLHVISNGGAIELMTLTKLLSKQSRPSHQRFPVALVLDSAPEASTLRCFVTGISGGYSSPLAKLSALPVILVIYSLYRCIYATPLIPEVRECLISPSLIPFRRNAGRRRDGTLIDYPQILGSAHMPEEIRWIPRLYVCSKADDITDINAVQAHVEEARRAGLDVRVEVYDDSPHVSHARVDPERYWTAVQQLWKDACLRKVLARL